MVRLRLIRRLLHRFGQIDHHSRGQPRPWPRASCSRTAASKLSWRRIEANPNKKPPAALGGMDGLSIMLR